jgi:hypothetical protein
METEWLQLHFGTRRPQLREPIRSRISTFALFTADFLILVARQNLGNMRELGVQSLVVTCELCQGRAVGGRLERCRARAHLRTSDGVQSLRSRRR